MANLKICIIQQSPDLGGAESYMLSLIGYFQKDKNFVNLITNKGKYYKLVKSKNIPLIKIPIILDYIGNKRGLVKSICLTPFALIFYISLLIKLKKKGIDIILMSGFSEKIIVSFLSLLFKIPVVWIEYGPLKDVFRRNFKFPKLIYRLTKNIPEYVIVPSENTKKSLIEDAHVSLSKLRKIYPGIELNNDNKRVDLPSDWRIKKIIGSISRLTPEKGQGHLIKSMPLILRKDPNARLLIVGDGPALEEYRKLAIDLGIKDKVLFTGYVEDVSPYFNKMDIFIFPTIWSMEGFGLVLIEAMSKKLPIVGSSIGPVPEIVRDDYSGYIVDTTNDELLAKTILKLLKSDKERKRLGVNGYELYKKQYSVELSANRVYEVLQDAVLQKKID